MSDRTPRMFAIPDSSNLKEIGYDAGSRRLYVRFKSGDLYRYADVSPEQLAELMSGPSIGAAFAAGVKARATDHPFEKVKE